MALKIRLRQQGRKNKRFYRIVVAEATSPRSGGYVEMLGWFDPFAPEERQREVKSERVLYWFNQGAQMTDKAWHIIAKADGTLKKTITELLEKKRMRIRARRRKRSCASAS